MGTNFYLRQKISNDKKELMKFLIDQENFDELDELKDMIPKKIHIGKQSWGWKFLWNANRFEYFDPTIKSLYEFLKSGDIYDEYGTKYDFDTFINKKIKITTGCDGLEWCREHNERWWCSYEDIDRFKDTYNVEVNTAGEFYIEGHRFTIHDEFS